MSYIVPIGPYHPALEEPIHATLYTEGEVIKDAEVFVGYNHRGQSRVRPSERIRRRCFRQGKCSIV